MNIERAEYVVESMAKKRGRTVLEVLVEWRKYQKNGECDHFWPDENTACRMILEYTKEPIVENV